MKLSVLFLGHRAFHSQGSVTVTSPTERARINYCTPAVSNALPAVCNTATTLCSSSG